MIEKIKMETRRYAKRQITWFKKNAETIWLNRRRKIRKKYRKNTQLNIVKGDYINWPQKNAKEQKKAN